jgi:hypothetical protein
VIGSAADEPASEAPVTDSERLKAQEASRLLREARLLPATQAATVLRPLIAMMQVGGEHSVEIEALQAKGVACNLHSRGELRKAPGRNRRSLGARNKQC